MMPDVYEEELGDTPTTEENPLQFSQFRNALEEENKQTSIKLVLG